jgi:hypothetical protein
MPTLCFVEYRVFGASPDRAPLRSPSLLRVAVKRGLVGIIRFPRWLVNSFPQKK